MYNLLKKCLFTLPPETAHDLALYGLNSLAACRLLSMRNYQHPIQLLGMTFPNPIGLAAGLDKNADFLPGLATLGFGFIEIGTVTPRPQAGNAKPRLFRLSQDEAIINRMGFNSKGADYVANRLTHTHYKGILGINLGKNRDTPLEKAADDYLYGMHRLWPFANYFTINISSPNTPGLRDLHQHDLLHHLLNSLKKQQAIILAREKKYIPLVVKISPDLTLPELEITADVIRKEKIDGIIATNTTVSRNHLTENRLAKEVGGLSGKPLQALSTQMVQTLHDYLPDIPIIAAGGIMDATSAREKLAAGAKLLQIYTGFIYHGPSLIKTIYNSML